MQSTRVISVADGADRSVPPRVMQICLSESWGGLEMSPGRITPELQRQGWEVHGMALAGTRVEAAFRTAGVAPLTFRSRSASLMAIWRVLRYLKQHDIRVLHAHKSSDMRIGALLVTLWPELRLFFTEHMGVKKPKKDFYHRWAYSRASRVFSISHAAFTWNREALPVREGQLLQLYEGVDFSAFGGLPSTAHRRRIRHSLGLSDGVIAIGLPGRVSPSKGHEVWLEALRRLDKVPGMPLWCGVVIGEASGRDAQPGGFAEQLAERVEEAGLSDRVVFAGFRDDLPDCLQAIEIACIPSVNEAFGLSVIEAMAAGCAVIGSASGAIPELVSEDRGRTADPNDPAAWAAALGELLGNPELRMQLGQASSQWVRGKFELSRHVKALTHYYRAQ